MKLSERLQQQNGAPNGESPVTVASLVHGDANGNDAEDAVSRLKRKAVDALMVRVGPALFDSSLTAHQLDRLVVTELGDVIKEERIPLDDAERDDLVAAITDQVLGYGPIERYLTDPAVTEIMVNGMEGIYVEKAGCLELTGSRFLSDDHILRVIDRIVGPLGRRIDESSPMVDARLPDGSRVNAIIPPLALDGPVLTIRKFATHALTVEDLIRLGSMTPEVATFLGACVRGRMNMLISGGTGTGKTTLLNVLSGMIPDGERVVTIEDAAELRLHQRHVIRLEGRPPNIEGRGEVRARDLVRNALRMRPDRIVVGEVRGAEAVDMLQAMNTGHDGSLTTLHANSPRDALARVETMVLMAGLDLPVRAIREQSASALDVMVHISRMRDGSRRLTSVCAVEGMEGDVVTLSEVFGYDYDAPGAVAGVEKGRLVATGVRPKLSEELRDRGIELPADVFV
ncbi:MAG: CpaF family protein [Acidimicrobiia bacterium]